MTTGGLTPRWDVGIVACSSSKHPGGMTPLTLYKGAPFSVTMKHACQRCDRVLIMSAKYGLLDLADPVRYYDTYIGNLSPVERALLWRDIRYADKLPRGATVLSYLPEAYQKLLDEALPWLVVRRPYAHIRFITMMAILSKETKNYGKQPARR